ncbi:MAG: proton-conducting transporter membrane subunit [Thermoprotei archaeon]
METVLYALVAAPIVANVFYRFRVEYATLAASVTTIVLLGLLYTRLPITGALYFDRMSWVFAISVCAVYLASAIYSTRYFTDIHTKFGLPVYYVLLNFFVASMLFTLVVNNLGFMWVGLEATTVSTVLLVLVEGGEAAIEAAWRYVVIVSTGVAFAFISVILVYYSLHTLELSVVPTESRVLALAVSIALVGFGTKVGVFPVNTWLPDAHSEAPAPISAMFSGVLLPVALYVLYRVYELNPIPQVFTWAATISIVVASIMLASQRNVKRLLAYSTIENMNLALLGFAVNQPLGALILIVAHAFGKSAAFYSSGLMYRLTGSKQIGAYGLWKQRYLPYSLILSSLTVTGAPPFATFVGEFLILSSLLRYSLVEFFIVLLSLGLSFVSVNFHVSRMVFQGEGERRVEDSVMGGVSVAASLIPLVLGVLLVWWLL